ncbi:MAG: hypothetical protein K8R02_03520 [Anaerohalosphaeraceae bacterium]|nr:hypothetical protein [Anaerohalosphaeraceae bacterium]
MHKKLRKPRKHRKAFTLSEVVVSSVLLLIAVVPMLKALTQANLNANIVDRRTQSLMLAQSKLNKVKAQSIYNFTDNFNQTGEVLKGSYLCNTTDDRDSILKAITVSVGIDKNGNSTLASDEIEVTLQTQVAKRWE